MFSKVRYGSQITLIAWSGVLVAVLSSWVYAVTDQLQRLWRIESNARFLSYLASAHLSRDFYVAYSASLQLIPALICIGVAIYIYWQQPTHYMVWLTSLTLLLLVILTSPAIFVLAQSPFWFWIVLPLGILGGISLTWLCVLFPLGRFPEGIVRWIAIGWTLILLSLLYTPLRNHTPVAWWLVLFALWIITMVAILWTRHQHTREIEDPQPYQWFILALLVPLSLTMLFHLLSLTLQWNNASIRSRVLYEINGMLFLLLFISTIPVSILLILWYFRLWNTRQQTHRKTVHRFLSIILILLYGFSVILIEQVLLATTGLFDSAFRVSVLALALAGFCFPFWWRLQQMVTDCCLHEPNATPVRSTAATLGSSALPAAVQTRLLSSRELDVLGLIADGFTNRQIADRLFITEGTVKRHTTNLYTKLGVHRRTQAVAVARQQKILP